MPYNKALARELIALEAMEQGVDVDLALSVAHRESRMDHSAVSRAGARGLMQLMPETANDLGVDAGRVPENIRGGVTYLKQQLDTFGGDEGLALAAYNAGPGAVKQHGGIPPYRETQGYVESVLRRTALRRELRGIEAIEAETGAQPPAGSTQAAPAADNDLPPVDTRIFPNQDPQKPAILAAPPSTELLIEKRPAALSKSLVDDMRSADSPEAGLAMNRAARTFESAPKSGGRPEVAYVEPHHLSSLRDLGAMGTSAGATAGGAALGTLILPGAGTIVGGTLGSIAGRIFNKAVDLEDPGILGDVLSAAPALGAVTPIVRAARRGLYGANLAEKAIATAGEKTAEKVATAQAQHAERLAAHEAGLVRSATVKAEREATRAAAFTESEAGRLASHASAVQQAEKDAEEATGAAMRAYAQKGVAAYDAASVKAKELQSAYRTARAEYDNAVTGQSSSVAQAKSIPGKYTPPVPARTLYAQLDDTAGSALVDLAQARSPMAALRADLEPLTALQPEAAKLRAVFSTIEALGDTTTVKDVNKLLRDIGPMARSSNGTVRYTALQAHDALSGAVIETGKALPETAKAGELMTRARAAWRQEKAVETLEGTLATGGPIITRDAAGREVVSVKAALNTLERTINNDAFFAGSFSKEQLGGIRRDFDTLIGTPTIPRQKPPLPGSVPVAESAPPSPVAPKVVPQFEPRRLRDMPRTAQEIAPRPAPVYTAPQAVAPAIEKTSLKGYLSEIGGPGLIGSLTGQGVLGAAGGVAVGVSIAGVDALRHKIANYLITAEGRATLLRLARKDGTIPIKAFAATGALRPRLPEWEGDAHRRQKR